MTHITYTDECQYVTNSAGRFLLTQNDKLGKSALKKTHAKDR